MVLRRAKDDEKDEKDEKRTKDDKDEPDEKVEPAPKAERTLTAEPVTSKTGTLTPVVGSPTVLGEIPNQPATRELHALAAAGTEALARGVAPPPAHRVLLWQEGGTLVPCDVTGPAGAREIMVGDVPYDHVDTDWETGQWIYRNDRQN